MPPRYLTYSLLADTLVEHSNNSSRSRGCCPPRTSSRSSGGPNQSTISSPSTVPFPLPSRVLVDCALICLSYSDIYIISSILIGSLLIFAGRDITYIDALFFAGGACTGAGLNPVDLD